MTDRELMQQALEAVEFLYIWKPDIAQIVEDTITALRERLTQPDQWQGLTDEEREQFRQWAHPDIIEAIELKLQERNA